MDSLAPLIETTKDDASIVPSGVRMDFIDALRGWAILGVALVHSTARFIPELPRHIGNLVSNGARGVQLFYLVSALTLFYSCEKKRGEPNELRNFAIRRFFRIAPLYFVVLCYIIQVFPSGRFPPLEIISHFLFFNGFNPHWINDMLSVEWSVAVEVIFYLMIPSIFKRVRTFDTAVRFLILTVLCGTVANWGYSRFLAKHPELNSYDWVSFSSFWLPTHLPMFAMGICCYFIIFKKGLGLKPFTLLMLFVWIFLQEVVGYDQLANLVTNFGLCFALLVVGLSQKPFSFFVNKLTIHFGKISYSMYLLHLVIFSYGEMYFLQLEGIFGHSSHLRLRIFTLFVFKFILATGLATLTYYLIERPFIKLGNKLISYFGTKKVIEA